MTNASDSIRLPLGFQTSSRACGIRGDVGRLDLALFYSEVPAVAAGVFTTNAVNGAPVKVCRERLPRSTARAVIINAGNANACTGTQGIKDAQEMTASLAAQIGCPPDDVLVCSTGVIGRFLPLSKITTNIPELWSNRGGSPDHLANTAQAIMTTDTVPKAVTREVPINGKTVTITGVCKGAAMIAPNMATMLCVIMTDAAVNEETVQSLITEIANNSFNSITVEGHTSTSDSMILLANGQSGVSLSDSVELKDALQAVASELAQKIIRDAEGAGHFVTINITGAYDSDHANLLGKTIANDALVKTAITGNDPNWGRIVSACGRTGNNLTENDIISLSINNLTIFAQGAPTSEDLSKVSAAMKTGEVVIDLKMSLGSGQATIWTCDLTQEYVRLNADYTT
jgi:glutamate N-acetyltransferase/amino-acid N-acetyltransferase